MDGQAILANSHQVHLRPWDQCIPFDCLSKENLPPFMVRLRDDQVGHLLRWVRVTHGLSPRQLGQHWPKTFTIGGAPCTGRSKWGPAYPGDYDLSGGPNLPSYHDPQLPLTWTSSNKIIKRGPSSTDGTASKKRKVSIKIENNDGGTDKKPAINVSGDAPREEMDDMVDKIDSLVAQLTESNITVDDLKAKITELEVLVAGAEAKLREQSATQEEKASNKLAAMQKTLNARNRHVRRLRKCIKRAKNACGDNDLTSESDDFATSDSYTDSDDRESVPLKSKSHKHIILRVGRRR